MLTRIASIVSPALLSAAALAAVPAIAQAAPFPLELVSPRAANTSPSSGQPAISPNNRVFWAYPGIEYNIKASVNGGLYPYTFSLSNAPSGMTIDAVTGEIRWTSPSGTATPTITVRDSENVTVSSAWTITTDASRFIFIDANNGREFDASPAGTGTLSNPYRRMRDLYGGSVYSAKTQGPHVNKIAYFRSGTYYVDGFIEDDNGTNYRGRMALLDGYKPVAWVAYPGETPTIDGQCFPLSPQIGARGCNVGRHIAFYGNGDNTYIDGFNLVNFARHAFQVSGTGNYQTFRRNNFNVLGPTIDSSNESWIMTMAAGADGEMGSFLTIQDNRFENVDQGSCVKLYSVQHVLIEGNVCAHGTDTTGGNDFEGFAIKGGTLERITVRRNRIFDIDQKGIGGNMDVLRSGEFLYNLIYDTRLNAIDINQDGVAGNLWIYRNTVVGQVRVRNTDGSDGPFYFNFNVFINNDGTSRIYQENVSAPARIVAADTLGAGSTSGVLDSNFNLIGAWAQYANTHGYQSPSASPIPGGGGGGGGGGNPTAPTAPRNVRIVP
jgi:hypothetical protein